MEDVKIRGGDASEHGDFQRGKQRLQWYKIFQIELIYEKIFRAARAHMLRFFYGGDVDKNRHFIEGK